MFFCSFSTEHSGFKSPKTNTCNSSLNCSKETSQEAMEKEFWQKLFSKCTFIIASGTCLSSHPERKKLEFLVLFSSHIWLLVSLCRYKVILWWAVYFSEPISFHTFFIFGDFSKCLIQLLCLLLWSLIPLKYYILSHAEPLDFPG